VATGSFGSRFYRQSYRSNDCLFLADGLTGLALFQLYDDYFVKQAMVSDYYESGEGGTELKHFSNESVVNTNGYVSVNENKRLLGIATKDKGYYLLNIKNNFDRCEPYYTRITVVDGGAEKNVTVIDINATRDFLIAEGGGSAIDAAFRDDGTYLYVSHGDGGITGYRTDILDPAIIDAGKTVFAMQNGAKAYNLKLFNNDNELFVTTDRGVQIYDVGNALDSLSFVGEYTTEGAQAEYHPAIDFYEDWIFLTDGYKGLKVLKLDNSFTPMLCGVEYFSPVGNPNSLAKTVSVSHRLDADGRVELLVGVSSYGIVRFRLDDLLFAHCKAPAALR
jgi:hypothetical protein